MNVAPTTLEYILMPGVFSAVVEFLDDNSLIYLKQQNVSLNCRISKEQESNSYWKSRVLKKLNISVQDITGLNWKVVYCSFKHYKSWNQIVIELFPEDFIMSYLEYQISSISSDLVEIFGTTIYRLMLQFDRVDIYDEVLNLLSEHMDIQVLGSFIYQAVESASSWNILVHLIPEILKELQTYYLLDNINILGGYVARFKENMCIQIIRYSGLSQFVLIDSLLPIFTDPEVYPRILRFILGVGNLNILEYWCIKYPKQLLELSQDLSSNIIAGSPKYPIATYLLSRMSDLEYSKFLTDIPDHTNVSLGIWKAIIRESRTPAEFIHTQVRQFFYNTPNIQSRKLLKFAKVLSLDPSKLLPNIKLYSTDRIGIDLFMYLLTTNRIPKRFRDLFNQLLAAMNECVVLSKNPIQKFSTLETIKLGTYLIDIFDGTPEARSSLRISLRNCSLNVCLK